MKPSEDAQPNEVRPSRKGANIVPTIRTAQSTPFSSGGGRDGNAGRRKHGSNPYASPAPFPHGTNWQMPVDERYTGDTPYRHDTHSSSYLHERLSHGFDKLRPHNRRWRSGRYAQEDPSRVGVELRFNEQYFSMHETTPQPPGIYAGPSSDPRRDPPESRDERHSPFLQNGFDHRGSSSMVRRLSDRIDINDVMNINSTLNRNKREARDNQCTRVQSLVAGLVASGSTHPEPVRSALPGDESTTTPPMATSLSTRSASNPSRHIDAQAVKLPSLLPATSANLKHGSRSGAGGSRLGHKSKIPANLSQNVSTHVGPPVLAKLLGPSFYSGTLVVTRKGPREDAVPSRTHMSSSGQCQPDRQHSTEFNHSPSPISNIEDLRPLEDIVVMTLDESGSSSSVSVPAAPEKDQQQVGSNHETHVRVGIREGHVRLPRDTHDKARRLLVSPTVGVLSITMRGSVDRIDGPFPWQSTTLRSASFASGITVDDACLLRSTNGKLMVSGYSRDVGELSIFRVTRNSVTEICTLGRLEQGDRRGGISAVCALMQPLMFASGGYDHRIHLWDATKDVARPSSIQIFIKHTSIIQSLLAIRDTSHKLVSAGADCNVHLWDLSSERVVNTLKTSNSVYHVHEASTPFCTLLEVAHRELQFEVRDHRLVPQKPVQRFGYTTPTLHGRYAKGHMKFDTFACGDKDGVVRLWDLRQLSGCTQTLPCFASRRVNQVVFDEDHLVVCSEEREVTFWKLEHL